MVMDANQPQQPSPQSVGREFVRQYYTLLNKAPNHLHRFYNNNSSFIHGEATLVVGQKNIHNRIQQLKFHDCHAKISQVDAQATLGNGVVVQVTGELSNDGQPMRRFTQTFVLAAQSPKKYYVHNDIFRYQDVYSDDDNDAESHQENEDEQEQSLSVTSNEQQVQVTGSVLVEQQQIPSQVVATGAGVMPQQQQQAQAAAPQQQPIYYSMPGGRPVPVLATSQGAAVALGPQYAPAGAVVPPPQIQQANVSQLNGVVHEDLLSGMQQANVGSQQPLVSQAGSMSSNVATVLAAHTASGVAAVQVVNANAMPQNVSGGIQGFQQSGIIQQQQLLQQQLLQQQQQQPLPITTQHSIQSQTPPAHASNEHIDQISNVVPVDTSSRSSANASASMPAPVPTPPPIVEDFKTINEQQQQEKYEAAKLQQQQQNEPKTYANLFKSTSSPSGFVNAAMQQQQQLQQQQAASNYQSNASLSSFSPSNSTMSSNFGNRTSDSTMAVRVDNDNVGSAPQSVPLPQRSNVGGRVNKDFDQRRPSNTQFGDNQQLFLGNIPHHASEEDLRMIFSRFGNVVDLRILTKAVGKQQPGLRHPPNYAFITYDDPESVQACLAHCPLYFPENSPDAQKLNVEEKKPRIRNDMPPRQAMNNMGNSSMNSQRGNMGGGPPSRSLANTGGGNMMRGSNPNSNNNMPRGPGGGSRIGGAFNRNDNRSGPSNGGGPQVRGGNNNSQTGGGNYGGRR